MSPHSPTASDRPDLRERRRRELVRTIAAAAVELFEKNGFQATTIDDIAEAAGISRTTFFRHCATKEAAVLVDDAGMEGELITAAAQAAPRHALRDLESAWERIAAVFDEDHQGRDRFLRVRRLMQQHPALHAAGLERDAVLTARIAEALRDGPGLNGLDAHAVAESFSLGMRLTFDHWVGAVDDAPDVPHPLTDIYSQARAALRRAMQTRTP